MEWSRIMDAALLSNSFEVVIKSSVITLTLEILKNPISS
jgi:hypothetical protein